jgi:glycosyltransferase involved in cell wall biosynthesis
MPEYCSRQKLAWLKWCYALALRKCHRVVAISGAVKEDLLRLHGEQWSDRIEVIWNPVCVERFAGGVDIDFTNGRPYILCVSVDRPPKNLYRLIKAFALVRKKFPDHCLVLAGQLRTQRRDWRERSAAVDETMPAAADLVEQLDLTDHVRVTGFIPDEQLGALYRGATMCVLPSLFEGFGMPAVESLTMGKPTLVSSLPVLREVTLGSAQYIDDPTNVDAMADSIGMVLDRPASFQPTQELVKLVRERFSPQEIARQYLRVLTA